MISAKHKVELIIKNIKYDSVEKRLLYQQRITTKKTRPFVVVVDSGERLVTDDASVVVAVFHATNKQRKLVKKYSTP